MNSDNIFYHIGYVLGKLQNSELNDEDAQELKEMMKRVHEIAENFEMKKKCPNCSSNTSNKSIVKHFINSL